MSSLRRNIILVGDARSRLQELPDASIDCVVTSPPYYLLRNYDASGQLGLEPAFRIEKLLRPIAPQPVLQLL